MIPRRKRPESVAHPNQHDRIHASRYSQSLLQLARQRRHGRRAGPDRHQLRDLGHRRHFPRLRPVDASPRSAAPKSGSSSSASSISDRLQQLGRQLGRPITPDQARALGLDRQLLGQMIAETALDERARAAAARRLRRRDRAPRSPRIRPSAGLTGQFDRSRFEYDASATIGYTEQRFVAEQRRHAAAPAARRHGQRRPAACRRPRSKRSTATRTSSAPSNMSCSDRAQAGDIPAPTPEVLAKYFEERKVAVPRAGIPQGRWCWR